MEEFPQLLNKQLPKPSWTPYRRNTHKKFRKVCTNCQSPCTPKNHWISYTSRNQIFMMFGTWHLMLFKILIRDRFRKSWTWKICPSVFGEYWASSISSRLLFSKSHGIPWDWCIYQLLYHKNQPSMQVKMDGMGMYFGAKNQTKLNKLNMKPILPIIGNQ